MSLHQLHAITSCPVQLHQLHDPGIDFMLSVVAAAAAVNAASPHQRDQRARGKHLFLS